MCYILIRHLHGLGEPCRLSADLFQVKIWSAVIFHLVSRQLLLLLGAYLVPFAELVRRHIARTAFLLFLRGLIIGESFHQYDGHAEHHSAVPTSRLGLLELLMRLGVVVFLLGRRTLGRWHRLLPSRSRYLLLHLAIISVRFLGGLGDWLIDISVVKVSHAVLLGN